MAGWGVQQEKEIGGEDIGRMEKRNKKEYIIYCLR